MKFIINKKFQKDLQDFVHQPQKIYHINEVMIDFKVHLFQSKYYRKPLKGYANIHELAVGGDLRIIIQVLIEDDITTFLRVGTHSSLGITGNQKKNNW